MHEPPTQQGEVLDLEILVFSKQPAISKLEAAGLAARAQNDGPHREHRLFDAEYLLFPNVSEPSLLPDRPCLQGPDY